MAIHNFPSPHRRVCSGLVFTVGESPVAREGFFRDFSRLKLQLFSRRFFIAFIQKLPRFLIPKKHGELESFCDKFLVSKTGWIFRLLILRYTQLDATCDFPKTVYGLEIFAPADSFSPKKNAYNFQLWKFVCYNSGNIFVEKMVNRAMLLLDSQPTLRTKYVATVTGRGLPRKFQDIIALEQDLVTKGLNAKGEKELLLLLQDVFSG